MTARRQLASGMYDTSLVCRKVQASAHRGSIVARLDRSPPEPLRGRTRPILLFGSPLSPFIDAV